MEAIICIGSNLEPDTASPNIRQAINRLSDHGAELLAESQIYPSSSGYMNYVARCRFSQDYDAVHALTKSIEQELGRTPAMKASGIVPVDIDIVTWGSEIMRPSDFASAYFKTGLNEI